MSFLKTFNERRRGTTLYHSLNDDIVENEFHYNNDRTQYDWTFSWLNNLLLTKARSHVLQTDDFPLSNLPFSCTCQKNGFLLNAFWNARLKESNTKNKNKKQKQSSSLLVSIINSYGLQYMYIGIFIGLSTLTTFIGPIILQKLVDCSTNPTNTWIIAVYILILFLSKIAVAFLSTQYEFQSAVLSIKIAAAIKSAVYQKALKLSTSSRRKYTAGNISNLYTTDIERVVTVVVGGHSIWILPLQIIAAR